MDMGICLSIFFIAGDIQILLEQPGPAVEPPLQIKVEHGIDSEKDLPMLKKELEETYRAKLMFRANVQLVLRVPYLALK
ncbi:hypothetical protein V7112_18145 [Bacillus sp. JJ1566]|uniref:hypothetical protein n=1 Tax=Bacillus sp. JJ1566 TaxID=3122961 RepID=UPI002FFDADF4